MLVLRLVLSADAALRRLGGRHPFITDDELRWSSAADLFGAPVADSLLNVEHLSAAEQLAAIGRIWH